MPDLNDPRIPILGQSRPQPQGPNAPGLTVACEVYDTEIIEIEKVLGALSERATRGRLNFDAFDREIKDRFHKIGFLVDVAWYHTDVAETKIPEIVIKDRTEARDFDYDRQVHEVTNDVLELGDKGVIKSDPKALESSGHQGHRH